MIILGTYPFCVGDHNIAGCVSIPDKVITAMSEAFHNVCLIILGTDHNDRDHSIGYRLAQLQTELVS